MSPGDDVASARDCCCGHPEREHTWKNGMISWTARCGHGDLLPPEQCGLFVQREWCHCAQYHPAKIPQEPPHLTALADARAEAAKSASIDLFGRIDTWRIAFERKAAQNFNGMAKYYRDAASGLAIALQEIDARRYRKITAAEAESADKP